MGKTVLVLLDACRYDAATETAGYLEHLIEAGLGAKYKVWGILPSMSRPMYETSMTGLIPADHGVNDNRYNFRSKCENIFSLCRKAGKKTAAAAYFWMAELYEKTPFDSLNDRFRLNGTGDIDHGIYYFEDQYPDSHLFLDGEFLRKEYSPDFLLIHSMNIDLAGHINGGGTPPYVAQVQKTAEFLARLIPVWKEAGYNIIVTADHGMSRGGYHGGPSAEQRTLPMYIFSEKAVPGDLSDKLISQLNLAPAICRLLDVEPAAAMLKDLEIKLK